MHIQTITRVALAVLVAAGTSTPAGAQDATAADVLAATRKAIGGEKLDAVKTFSVQTSVQRNVGNIQAQAEVEILLELPDKYLRSEVSSGVMNMNVSTGFSGERAILPPGASVMPGGGGMVIRMGPGSMDPHPTEKPTPEQLEQMNRSSLRNYRQEISRLMLGWFGMAHPSLNVQYTYAGEAESPDGKAHVIDVKNDDGFAARLFIDQNNHLPLMVTYKGRQGRVMGSPMTRTAPSTGESQRPRQLSEEEVKKLREEQDKRLSDMKSVIGQPSPMVDVSLYFGDWREVDGVLFPHSIRRASEGTTNEEWTITKVKVNPKIDARKFAVETR